MKKFRKRTEGFTLVELVVVIAILGILAGVGTVGYSGYVKKANMQADINLAREIEQAMMLAYYNSSIEDGATVIVTTDDVTVADDTGADEAMAAVFGSGYADTVRLKYGGWAEEMATLLTPGAIANVQDSTFKGEALGYLLDDVQMVVGALGNFLEGKDVPDALVAYMKENGLTTEDVVTTGNKSMVSNMATLFVANNLHNIDSDAFAQKWNGAAYEALRAGIAGENVNPDAGNFGTLTGETLAQGAALYARVEALANYVDAKNGNSAFYSMMPKDPTQFQDVSGLLSLQGLLDAVEGQILTTDFATYCEYFGITAAEGYTIPSTYDSEGDFSYLIFPEAGTATQAAKDSDAFLSYMGGLSESADSLVRDTDLNSGTYFNDGTMQQYVENYMAIGQALADGNYPSGAFMFIYKNGAVNCAPLDY